MKIGFSLLWGVYFSFDLIPRVYPSLPPRAWSIFLGHDIFLWLLWKSRNWYPSTLLHHLPSAVQPLKFLLSSPRSQQLFSARPLESHPVVNSLGPRTWDFCKISGVPPLKFSPVYFSILHHLTSKSQLLWQSYTPVFLSSAWWGCNFMLGLYFPSRVNVKLTLFLSFKYHGSVLVVVQSWK